MDFECMLNDSTTLAVSTLIILFSENLKYKKGSSSKFLFGKKIHPTTKVPKMHKKIHHQTNTKCMMMMMIIKGMYLCSKGT
jgi:hypothetical protein